MSGFSLSTHVEGSSTNYVTQFLVIIDPHPPSVMHLFPNSLCLSLMLTSTPSFPYIIYEQPQYSLAVEITPRKVSKFAKVECNLSFFQHKFFGLQTFFCFCLLFIGGRFASKLYMVMVPPSPPPHSETP